MKFAICFHHTNEDLQIWHDFNKYFSEQLGETSELVTFSSFLEEKKLFDNNEYDIVFENPEITLSLIEKGYIPIGRFENNWDVVYYVAKKGFQRNKKAYKVGIVPLQVILSTILELEKIGIDSNEIEFCNEANLNDILQKVLSGELDFGITRKDSFSRLPEDIQNQYDILLEFSMGIFHAFLLNPEIEERYRGKIIEVLLNMHKNPAGKNILSSLHTDKIVPVGYELYFLSRFSELGGKVFDYRNFKSLSNVLNSAPNVGVIIHDEKIKYINGYIKDITGYTESELLEKAIYELISYQDKSGDIKLFDDTVYKEVDLHRKNGSISKVLLYNTKVIFNGVESKAAMLIDITRRKILENMFMTLKEINHIIITGSSEDEVFSNACKLLVEKSGFKFAWIGLMDVSSNRLTLNYEYGNSNNYKECIKKFLEEEDTLSSCYLSIRAFYEGKILINSDSTKLNSEFLYKNAKISNNLMSSCSIPVFKDDKVYATINIYSDQIDFFQEDVLIVLEELMNDISFAISKIEKEKEARTFFSAIEKSKDWFVITDSNGKIEYVNEAVCKISGFSRKELIGKKTDIFKSGYHDEEYYKNLWETLLSGRYFENIIVNRKKDGGIVYLEIIIIPVTENGKITKFVSNAKDITNEIVLKGQVESLKYTDIVSNTYNYAGFKLHASKIIELREFDNKIFGIVIIDIFNMGYINNLFGVEIGDRLLKTVGSSLKKILRSSDIVGRIGGDDFGIFCVDIKRKDNMFRIVEKIKNLFKDEFDIEGIKIKVNINMGISIYPEDDENISNLIEKARLALGKAKKLGEGRIEFYNPKLENTAIDYFYTDRLLMNATKEDRYILYYQPYYYCNNMELAGVEALIRLKDYQNNILTPNRFIDYLENSIYLEEFEQWLIKKAISFIEKYRINISINISAKLINKTIINPSFLSIPIDIGRYLTIEITEREINNAIENYNDEIRSIKLKTGVNISIDDFGTGYSSLSRLKDLPADIVKIDMSFIRDMEKSEKNKDFVAAIIDLSRRFHFKTVAEGVESSAQLKILQQLGCDMVQGYLFSKPVPEEKLTFYRQ